MSFIKTSFSAIGKLFIVATLAGAFLVGLVGVVYLSLRGEEINVPEVVGKDFSESEKELTQLGLKIKRRATRYSQEKPNTILEQSPKAGTTAKTGQQILVVVSQVNPESTEAPATVEKEEEDSSLTDDGTDKSKKTNKNSNVKKPAQTSRDVNANKPNKNSNVNTGSGEAANTSKSNTSGAPTNPGNKNGTTPPNNKPTTPPAATPKPNANKTVTSGDTRTRKVPNFFPSMYPRIPGKDK